MADEFEFARGAPDVLATEFHCDVCGFSVGPLKNSGWVRTTLTTRCWCGTVVEIVDARGPV